MEFKTVGRDRLARELLKLGPITASDLADSLGISAVAVRKHLDDMSEKSLVESHEVAPFGPAKPKGRGRPARVYSLTAQGRDFFENQYQSLAQDAVRYLATNFGNVAVKDFATNRASEMFKKYSPSLEKAKTVEQKVELLSRALTKDGFAATADKGSGPTHTVQLCQHNCPIAHVAAEFPQLCEAETELFSKLLGTHVQRLATIAHGDGVCTTFVPKNKKQLSSGKARS